MGKKKCVIFYVDPMSTGNMAAYDYNLISNIPNTIIKMFGNINFEFTGDLFKYNDNVNFYGVFNYREKKIFIKGLSYIISILNILCRIFMQKPSGVHFQWLRLPKFDRIFLGILKITCPNVKIVYTAHNVLPHDSGQKYYRDFYSIYNKVDEIIVHTEYTKKQLELEFGIEAEKISVIKHGPISLKQDLKVFKDYYTKLSNNMLFQDKVVFGFLGSISEYKGIRIVMDLWEKKCINKSKEIVLIIAGKPSDEIETSIYEFSKRCSNVYLDLRFLSNEEFQAYLEICDVIIMPYKRISQSGILLSALEKEVPVIVSNVGGLADPFEYGNVGWRFNIDNVKELERIVMNILINKSIIREIKNDKKTWMKVKLMYSWEKIGIDTEKVYSKKS